MSQRSRILVLATGGTIAGEAETAASASYRSGQVGIETLLARSGTLGDEVLLRAEQIANIGSQDMEPEVWGRLLRAIDQAFAADRADGVVITHGTDTAEETAFLLDLLLPGERPVVLVSAMRASNVLGADGPRNLANAIRLAADPQSRGRGVLAVLGDHAFAARDLYKAVSDRVEAFRGFPLGPVARLTPAAAHYLLAPQPAPWRGRLAWPADDRLPPVAVLYAHAAMDRPVVEAVLAAGLAGVVVAGVGHGNGPQWLFDRLAAARGAGLAVVRAARLAEAVVGPTDEIADQASGFLTAGTLNPQKARLLLQLLIANNIDDLADRQAFFDLFR